MLVLENSYHMITIDQERGKLIERAAAFFAGIADRVPAEASAPASDQIAIAG